MKLFIAVLVLCANSECVMVSANDNYYTQADCEKKVKQISEAALRSGMETFAAACIERNLNNHTRN